MQRPINEQVRLAATDEKSVTYLQREETWEKHPPTATVSDRSLTLKPVTYASGYKATQFCFDLGPGIRCYGGILWPSNP